MNIRLNRDETGYYVTPLKRQLRDINGDSGRPFSGDLQLVIIYTSTLDKQNLQKCATEVKDTVSDFFFAVMGTLGIGERFTTDDPQVAEDLRGLLRDCFASALEDVNVRHRDQRDQIIFRRILVIPGHEATDSHLKMADLPPRQIES